MMSGATRRRSGWMLRTRECLTRRIQARYRSHRSSLPRSSYEATFHQEMDVGEELDLFAYRLPTAAEQTAQAGNGAEDYEPSDVQGELEEEEEEYIAPSPSAAMALLLQRLGLDGLRQLVAARTLRIVDGNNHQYALGSGWNRHLGTNREEEEEVSDDSDGGGYWWMSNTCRFDRKMSDRWKLISEGLEAGRELRWSGEFGRVRRKAREWQSSAFQRPFNLSSRIAGWRTRASPLAGGFSCSNSAHSYAIPKQDLSAYVPNHEGVEVTRYSASPVYVAAYSPDGSFYYTCCRDFTIQLYDATKAPSTVVQHIAAPDFGGARRRLRPMANDGLDDHDDLVYTTLHQLKSVRGRVGGWTVTDAVLSPDNLWMIYATASSAVTLIPTSHEQAGDNAGEDDGGATPAAAYSSADQRQVVLDFGAADEASGRGRDTRDSSPIWSLSFSGDSKEIIAGAKNGEICVYDIEARCRVLGIDAHNDDVNAVCFADDHAQNMLISGSDDSFVKVWDRRSLSGGKAAGWLPGHTEGISYLCPKGDGRYLLSNGKDQACKLWDLRMMKSEGSVDRTTHFGIPRFDYRTTRYPRPRYMNHPQDASVMSYRGHSVLYTLVRCRFSPASTTGQQYVYSGSADGRIHIWSLDGQLIQVLDRAKAQSIFNTRDDIWGSRGVLPAADPLAPVSEFERAKLDLAPRTNFCVRDVSWSPTEPVLMSASWEGGRGTYGSVVRHEWKGFGKNGLTSLSDWTERLRNEIP
ncbi:WD40 repeat-like protein [Tilletiaria anomala UBC 951]|uniref:WD40 repeat-like protein n=1 Tax=Tilletiaria anomala (strain ATCC 24038 / CBS 436.72 / UBC 951) TaxID=1037660 RepID=A0A066V903_TILAU|nr:WD40 repeat-like protein [Tilletiaria anomala UBC 951]KDN37936.1 WD40 repeat-like protein [Tilletiaria anomala UBC 951]